jgi:hypothetical protein
MRRTGVHGLWERAFREQMNILCVVAVLSGVESLMGLASRRHSAHAQRCHVSKRHSNCNGHDIISASLLRSPPLNTALPESTALRRLQ